MIDVFSQGYEAALLFCIGLSAGLLFDLFGRIGSALGGFWQHLFDLMFVLLSGALLLFGTLLAANGRMRAFHIMAFTAGAALCAWAFYPVFFKKLQKIRK